MKKFKAALLAGFALVVGLSGFGQEKALTVKANFQYDSQSRLPSIISSVEVNALLARGGRRSDRVYSSSGRIEAQIESPLSYNSEYDEYDATFTDIVSGKSLGKFKLSGELFPANDGKHFITFSIHGGAVSLFEYASPQRLRELGDADQIRLSEDGSKVLVAKYRGHSVELNCFGIDGKEIWSQRLPYTNFSKIAISFDGKYAAISANLLDPQGIEEQQKVSETIAEAKRQWVETNRQRRAQNLPELPFVRPVFPEIKAKSVEKGQFAKPTKALIFLDDHGTEIGRTAASMKSFINLVFAKDGGSYLATSNANEISLYDASSAIVLQKKVLELSAEINSLDLNQRGEIVAAVITHPTKVKGGAVDRGLLDPRLAILWNTTTSEMKIYAFDRNLQIPRDQFFASLSDPSTQLLVNAGEQFFVFEK